MRSLPTRSILAADAHRERRGIHRSLQGSDGQHHGHGYRV